MTLHISTRQLKPVRSAPGLTDNNVAAGAASIGDRDSDLYVAALFERDLKSGKMRLQGLTPWTRYPITSALASSSPPPSPDTTTTAMLP